MSRLCHLFFLSLFVSPAKIKTSFNFHIDRGRREHLLKMIYEICTWSITWVKSSLFVFFWSHSLFCSLVSFQWISQLSGYFLVKKNTHFQIIKNPVKFNSVLPIHIQFKISPLIIHRLDISLGNCIRKGEYALSYLLSYSKPSPMNLVFGFSWMRYVD